jgi:hypothetical protein
MICSICSEPIKGFNVPIWQGRQVCNPCHRKKAEEERLRIMKKKWDDGKKSFTGYLELICGVELTQVQREVVELIEKCRKEEKKLCIRTPWSIGLGFISGKLREYEKDRGIDKT